MVFETNVAILSPAPARIAGVLGAWAARLGVALLLLAPLPAADRLPQQQEVQAVFLLHLTRFIRWPDNAFAAEDAPLVIGFFSDDPVGLLLDEVAHGELAGKHPIATRRIHVSADLNGCHMVYYGRGGINSAAQMIASLRDKPVLTVSDAEGFLRLGGHVQFFTRGGQLKLRVDLRNLKRAELTASSQLLRVAEASGN